MKRAELDRLLEANRSRLLALPDVVGVGIGLCEHVLCIQVFVTQRAPGLEERVEEILSGVPFRIVVSGEFRPLGG